MTRTEKLIYCAGFFDGEGCVGIYKVKSVSAKVGYQFSLQLSVTQKSDRKPLDMLQELFGGTVQHRVANDVYKWSAACQVAQACLTELLPYLVVKKAQAKIAIAFQARREYGSHQRSKSNLKRDNADYNRIKTLKHAIVYY